MGQKLFWEKIAHACEMVQLRRRCAGQRIAVDISIWCVRAVKRHSHDVVLMGNFSKAIADVMALLCGLRIIGASPIVVLDGRRLPGKSATQQKRRDTQKAAVARVEAARSASKDPSEADITAAACVTSDFYLTLINKLRASGCSYVVSPYESDAQMVHMARTGQVQFVMTDDNDILAGMRTGDTWGVLQGYNSSTHAANLYTPQALKVAKPQSDMQSLLNKWGPEIIMCVAAVGGCDYGNIPGVGIVTALKALRRLKAQKQVGHPKERPADIARVLEQETKGNAKAEDTAAHIAKVIEIYEQQVVYNMKSAENVHLSGADVASSACGAKVSGNTTMAGVQITEATAHSLGRYVHGEAAASADLVPVEVSVNEETGMPQHLAAWMVPGATINANLVTDEAITAGSSSAAAPSKAELRLFLLTRSYAEFDKKLDTWAKLAGAVQKRLRWEEEQGVCMCGGGSSGGSGGGGDGGCICTAAVPAAARPFIRDPSGRSVQQCWAEGGRCELAEFPQFDATRFKVDDDGQWQKLTAMELGKVAPSISKELLRSHFAPRSGAVAPGTEPRVLRRAFQRLEGMRSVNTMYHAAPMSGEADVVAVTMRVPASFSARSYDATVFLRVDAASPAAVKPVLEILHAVCMPARRTFSGYAGDVPDADPTAYCKASGVTHTGDGGARYASNQCTHISCVLQLLHNLPRAQGSDVAVPATSQLCKWVRPGAGATLELATQLSEYEFRKADLSRVTERRASAATGVSARPLRVPFSKASQCNNHTRGESAALWDKCMDAIAASFAAPARKRKRCPTPTVGADEVAQAAATRYTGTEVLVSPPPVRGARQDNVSGVMVVRRRVRQKLEVQHLDSIVLVDPARITPVLCGRVSDDDDDDGGGGGGGSRGSKPCVCGCGKDCNSGAFKPHAVDSKQRKDLFRSLGMDDTEVEQRMLQVACRVHASHFTPAELKPVYTKDTGALLRHELRDGALCNRAPHDEVAAMLHQLPAEDRAAVEQHVRGLRQQAAQSQHAHAEALAALAAEEERGAGVVSYESMCGPLAHKCREYTGFYSVAALDAFLLLLDGGCGLFSTLDPATAGEVIGVTAEMVTSRHSGFNVGEWVAPVTSAGGRQTRGSSTEPHTIPADTPVQVVAVHPPVGDDEVARMDVLMGGTKVEGVQQAAFATADAPAAPAAPAAGSKGRGGRRRMMCWKTAVIFVLFVLRSGMDMSIADGLFGIPHSTACRYFVVYLQALRHRLEALFPYPTAAQLAACCPERIRKLFPGRRIQALIDAHEQQCEEPSDLTVRRSVWSDYKHYCSAKFLGSVAPNGATIDTSEPRGGACDDKTLTVASGVLGRAYAGMTTLADKGFMMHGEYMELMHELLTPPKKRSLVATFSTGDMEDTHAIAAPRAHVERAFKRAQEWRWMHNTLKLTQIDLSGSAFSVIMRMCNFDTPLIREGTGPLKCLAELTWGRRGTPQ